MHFWLNCGWFAVSWGLGYYYDGNKTGLENTSSHESLEASSIYKQPRINS